MRQTLSVKLPVSGTSDGREWPIPTEILSARCQYGSALRPLLSSALACAYAVSGVNEKDL